MGEVSYRRLADCGQCNSGDRGSGHVRPEDAHQGVVAFKVLHCKLCCSISMLRGWRNLDKGFKKSLTKIGILKWALRLGGAATNTCTPKPRPRIWVYGHGGHGHALVKTLDGVTSTRLSGIHIGLCVKSVRGTHDLRRLQRQKGLFICS